jgi:hypothetical protein
MADSIVGTAAYLTPGQSIKIKCPINAKNYQGYFAELDTLPSTLFTGQNPSDLIRGFIVENSDVGTITATSIEEAAVIYTHKKPYGNAIWFFARTGERGLVKVISVPIHDHSTIIHGGPAYGTYFDDDIER